MCEIHVEFGSLQNGDVDIEIERRGGLAGDEFTQCMGCVGRIYKGHHVFIYHLAAAQGIYLIEHHIGNIACGQDVDRGANAHVAALAHD